MLTENVSMVTERLPMLTENVHLVPLQGHVTGACLLMMTITRWQERARKDRDELTSAWHQHDIEKLL